MRITFTGTVGGFITKNRSYPSVLIDDDLLLDCGEGTTRNLEILDADLTKIERILLTHAHADHYFGFISLLWKMSIMKRESPLTVICLLEVERCCSTLLDISGTDLELIPFPLSFETIGQESQSGDISLCGAKHEPTNIACRVDREGGSVCYAGDTAYSKNVVRLAKGCDVLIHDSAFPDEKSELANEYYHSTPSIAGKVASEAGAQKLVLFHISGEYKDLEDEYVKQAKRLFSGEVIIAKDFLELNI